MTGNLTAEITGESTVLVSDTEYDCYVAEMTGGGQYDFMGIVGTWTMDGKGYMQKSDLADVKMDLAITTEITQPESHTIIGITNTTYSHSLKEADFPLTVGKIWTVTTTENVTSKNIIDGFEFPEETITTEISRTYNCTRTETTTVPAGTFDTFVIKYTDQDGNYAEYYYSPEVGSTVKELSYSADDTLLFSMELLEFSYTPPVTPLELGWWVWVVIGVIVVIVGVVAVIFVVRRGKKPPTPTVAPTLSPT